MCIFATFHNFVPSIFQADFTFFQSCKKDYRKYEDKYDCGKGKTRHGMLANVLLCLEAALNDGKYCTYTVQPTHSEWIPF